jgi:hypothetical protein
MAFTTSRDRGKYGPQICMKDLVKFFVGHLLEFLFHIDACVVDQDIDASIAGNDLIDEGGEGGEVVQVVGKGGDSFLPAVVWRQPVSADRVR